MILKISAVLFSGYSYQALKKTNNDEVFKKKTPGQGIFLMIKNYILFNLNTSG